MKRHEMTSEQITALEKRQAEMQAEETARQAAMVAHKAARDDALKEIPRSENSIPALRDEINKIKAILRGE